MGCLESYEKKTIPNSFLGFNPNYYIDLEGKYKNIFAYEYTRTSFMDYKNSAESQENPELTRKLSQIEDLTFNGVDPGNQERIIYDPETGKEWFNSNFEELIFTFTNIHIFDQKARCKLALAHLYNLIDYWKEYYPEETYQLQKTNKDFQEKFFLMSSSSQFLTKLNRIKTYLEKEFTKPNEKFHWFKKKKELKHVALKKYKELDILSEYVRVIEQENFVKNETIKYQDELYKYCQFELIVQRMKNIKLKIIELRNYYGKFIS
jgi:hypothetical protein